MLINMTKSSMSNIKIAQAVNRKRNLIQFNIQLKHTINNVLFSNKNTILRDGVKIFPYRMTKPYLI